jgi:hypothetical protein
VRSNAQVETRFRSLEGIGRTTSWLGCVFYLYACRGGFLATPAHSARSVCAGAEHKYQHAQRKNPGEHEEAVADERV